MGKCEIVNENCTNKLRVAGTVILYRSDLKVLRNIQTYLPQINHLYVIDNSEIQDIQLVNEINNLPQTTYVFNGANKGIAYALNKAAHLAIDAGYMYLLTMDDDTAIPYRGIYDMFLQASQYDLAKVGIIAAQSDHRYISDSISIVPYTITSGNLLNLQSYIDCGPFLEDLFIDFVDIEYCFRLSKKGYKIIEINNIQLDHRLGLEKKATFLFEKIKISWGSHSPERVYYKIRNCLYIVRTNIDIPISLKIYFFKDILREIGISIFLEDKKWNRFNLLIKAFKDSLFGHLGIIYKAR